MIQQINPKIKNILIISAVFPPEPIVSALLSRDIAEELAKNNNVVVICPQPSRPENFIFENDKIYKNNYNVIRLNSYKCPSFNIIGRMRESFSFGLHSIKYSKKNFKQIDCIYVNSWPLLSQYLIVKTAKKFNIPCVMHVQDIYPESLLNKIPIGKSLVSKLLLPVDRYTLKNSSSIIVISENMKRILVNTRKLFFEKVTVIPNWQNEEKFISFNTLKNKDVFDLTDSLTFMYLGNNGPLAGVETLINSFFKASIPNSKLIIAGSGSKKKVCIDLVNKLAANNIEFISVPENMVPFVQDKADVLLLPVKKNGAMSSIPSKLPAYMFSAKTILGSLDLESDTAKAIKDSGCGIVVEPENEIELINAMIEVSKWSKSIRVEKGTAGFNYAILNFSKESNLNKVISVIQELV